MRKITLLALFFATVCMVTGQAFGAEKPIRLKMATQYMDRHVVVQKVYKPWIEEMKKRTNGRVIIQLYNPNTVIPDAEIYNGLVKDQIDLGDHYFTRFPGVFPACTMTGKLPMRASNATVASIANWRFIHEVPEAKAELKGIHLLAVHSTSPLQILSKEKEIKTRADMKGLKFIGAGKDTTLSGKAFDVPVIMQPGPDIYMALSRNMAQGVIYPIPPIRSFKVNEATKYILISSMWTTPCFFAMSEQRWNSLPDDIKKVFEETTGETMTKALGAALDAGEKADLDAMIAEGMKVNYLSKEERNEWKEILTGVFRDAWFKEVEGKLANAEAIYAKGTAIFEECEAQFGPKN